MQPGAKSNGHEHTNVWSQALATILLKLGWRSPTTTSSRKNYCQELTARAGGRVQWVNGDHCCENGLPQAQDRHHRIQGVKGFLVHHPLDHTTSSPSLISNSHAM